jgi:hypothetical protein
VVYAGLFFLFGGKDAEPVPRRPHNWRRIMGAILAGLVVGSLIAAIIYSQEQERQRESFRRSAIAREQANREEQRKRAAQLQEWEENKHRITRSEIDLIDLQLGPISNSHGSFFLTGRIRNRAAHNRMLNSITLIVSLREKGSPDILGEQMAQIRVEVPPHQTRAIFERIDFPNLPYLTQHALTYDVTEIRASEGKYDDLFDMNAPAVSPTPSPTPKGRGFAGISLVRQIR